VRFHVACAFGLVALFASQGVAHAFCRTTTVHEPVPFNPVTNGCWTQGAAIAWPGGQKIPYSIAANASRYISLADATRVAALAFSQWNDVSCSGDKPNVQAVDNGPVSPDAAAKDCGLHQCDPTVHDGMHLIVFDDANWPHNDPNNTLALTTVTYGVDSGDIYDADIEINTAQQAIVAEEPPPAGTYDLQAILTHEAGHFFGLAHATSSTPIMYAQYQPGAITLTRDDVAGMCAMYTPTPTHGCACSAVPARSGALALGAASMLAVVLATRGRRRRPRSG
jgi:hypothetical protein